MKDQIIDNIKSSISDQVAQVIDKNLLMAYEVENNLFSGNFIFYALTDVYEVDCEIIFKINDKRYRHRVRLHRYSLMSLNIKDQLIEIFFQAVGKELVTFLFENNISELRKIF